jgi:hypothetical protein
VLKVTERKEVVPRPAFPKPPYTQVRYRYKNGAPLYSQWIKFNERPGTMKSGNRINVPSEVEWIEFK